MRVGGREGCTSQGAGKFSHKIDIQISKATPGARAAVEAAGGSVTQVYYNELGLRALFKVSVKCDSVSEAG